MSKPAIKKKKRILSLKRLTTKYKVSIMNESTLEEVYNRRVSALGLSVITILLIIATILFFSALILYTPLKGFLPENVDDNLRETVATESLQIDSLTEVVELQDKYIEALKAVLSGDIAVDTTAGKSAKEVLVAVQAQQFKEKTEAEKDFARNYEDDEKFNLMNATQESKSLTFQHPAKGIITGEYNPSKGSYGIDISTLPQSSVSAVYQGIVFNSGYDFSSGYYVEIIHPQNYISIYKHLAGIYVRKGENVKAGQVIGTMYNGDKGTGKHVLHFELWNENVAQNPLDYMVFE
ncbi:MAG: M23 family metallopeptidase [Bacteroidales bacterium]|nr:M23 family metallopeptidase [Bacteroidales bacterium]MDY6427112.1 M23 family metallopeptidase [Bacteroidales bacterium]